MTLSLLGMEKPKFFQVIPKSRTYLKDLTSNPALVTAFVIDFWERFLPSLRIIVQSPSSGLMSADSTWGYFVILPFTFAKQSEQTIPDTKTSIFLEEFNKYEFKYQRL